MEGKPIDPGAHTAQSIIQAEGTKSKQDPDDALAEARAAHAAIRPRQRIAGTAAASPDLRPLEDSTFKKIKLKDGRFVVLGPPAVPTDLILPKMFSDRVPGPNNVLIMTDMQNAEVCMYIRQIDEAVFQGQLTDWAECVQMIKRLGEIGFRSVKNAHAVYFGVSETFWEEVKN